MEEGRPPGVVTICKASLVSVIRLANRIIIGEFAANINFYIRKDIRHCMKEPLTSLPIPTTTTFQIAF